MIATGTTYVVRHLRASDRLPKDLWGDGKALNPHWVWVLADDRNEVQAVLITAPAHSVVLLLRIWATEGLPFGAIRSLLREAAKECKALGMVAWMVMLEGNRPKELKLARLCLRMKGIGRGIAGLIYGGRLEDVCHSHQR